MGNILPRVEPTNIPIQTNFFCMMLIAARDDKLLGSAIGADFRSVDIAVRIHGQVVKDIKLPGRVAAAAERRQNFERLSIENSNLCITQIRYI